MKCDRFITVEGIEGVGKSTNLAYIKTYFEALNDEVLITREPGGTLLGEEVREILLAHRHDGMADDTELLLMFAARAEHIATVIKPALVSGKTVLCDRFTDATYAYQGGGRGITSERIATLENWVQGTLRPSLTLLLDVSVDIGLQRAGKRNKADRFEKEQHDFFDRVRACYLERARHEPDRFQIIDASQSIASVQDQLTISLDRYMRLSQA